MLINILIPSYNRSKSLEKNLRMLDKYIDRLKVQSDVKVIVSDNGSSDDEDLVNRQSVSAFNNNIEYYHQQENVGYEKNILFLLNKSESEYAMYLGDDDYLSYELFSLIIEYAGMRKYSCIVCNYFLVNENGKKIGTSCRDPISKDKVYSRGDMIFALKGHQLSCLVFKTKGVLEYYYKNCKSNLYPTIAFIGYSMSCGEGVHITRYPYANTQIEKKNFDYSFDNLLEDACKCYESLPFSDVSYRIEAYTAFLDLDKDRFVNRQTFIHPFRFIKKAGQEYHVSTVMKKKIIRKFILEWFKLPFRYGYNQVVSKLPKHG